MQRPTPGGQLCARPCRGESCGVNTHPRQDKHRDGLTPTPFHQAAAQQAGRMDLPCDSSWMGRRDKCRSLPLGIPGSMQVALGKHSGTTRRGQTAGYCNYRAWPGLMSLAAGWHFTLVGAAAAWQQSIPLTAALGLQTTSCYLSPAATWLSPTLQQHQRLTLLPADGH